MRRFQSVLLATVAAIGFASVAFAGDMPKKAPVYNWTGFYVGGNVGYGWGVNSNSNVTFVDDSVIGLAGYFRAGGNVMPSVQQKGAIGGLQFGYNWVLSPTWVIGLVADLQASDMKASATNTVTPPGRPTSNQSNSLETDWFGTVRAKVGFAQNNWLFYGTGGLAYGQVKASGFWNVPAVPFNFAGSVSTTRAGWAAGAGIDYGFTRNWTIGVEYLHVDLGGVSYTDTSTNGIATLTTLTISNRAAANIARATLNYKL